MIFKKYILYIRIDSLKGEVELLNEDNFNLETEVKILKDEREKVTLFISIENF